MGISSARNKILDAFAFQCLMCALKTCCVAARGQSNTQGDQRLQPKGDLCLLATSSKKKRATRLHATLYEPKHGNKYAGWITDAAQPNAPSCQKRERADPNRGVFAATSSCREITCHHHREKKRERGKRSFRGFPLCVRGSNTRLRLCTHRG